MRLLSRKKLIVGIAIGPSLADLAGGDDWVLSRVKVRGGVAVRRVVAAANMAAREAAAEMGPAGSHRKTLLAAGGRRVGLPGHFAGDVGAGVRQIEAFVGFHGAIMRASGMSVEGC